MTIAAKVGDRIRGYRLVTDFTNNGAGTALWCFAEKDGREYFLKQFLHPVYPLDSHPGTPAGKAKRRKECECFEHRTRRVNEMLGAGGDGGFLIRALDFFREEGHYFKVTDRVKPSDRHVERLGAVEQRTTLLTVAYSLKMLHQRSSVVHGDIKPDNIILEGHGSGVICKLIDFDACFFEDEVPSAVEMTGDQVYQAPEVTRYIAGESLPLTQKVDVFAAGLVFARFLSGHLPALPGGHHYTGEALLEGHAVTVPEPARHEMRRAVPIIEQMIALDPAARPTMAEVHEELRDRWKAKAPPAPVRTRMPVPAVVDPSKPRLVIKGLPGAPTSAAPASPAPAPSAPFAPRPPAVKPPAAKPAVAASEGSSPAGSRLRIKDLRGDG
jgi:serine/threonine protein kinase